MNTITAIYFEIKGKCEILKDFLSKKDVELKYQDFDNNTITISALKEVQSIYKDATDIFLNTYLSSHRKEEYLIKLLNEIDYISEEIIKDYLK